MKNLDFIAEELFNKIRGRFPSVTIGDGEGKVTSTPKQARYFDFMYKEGGRDLGRVSISLEEEALALMYTHDFITKEDDMAKSSWYEFLKELRYFAKKRLLTFDTRDITKSNLNRRDYKFLAQNRSGEDTMTESKLYGTSKISYQDVGAARLVVKHSKPVNQELPAGRTQHINALYIESSEGERFKYPFRHLNGARAMARHVSEGGNAYDEFGKHIVSLSEEMAKLRKFKNYMNRSGVMAEGLAGYMDIVNERIGTVKKTLENLQKINSYAQAIEDFRVEVLEDVPHDVAESWIDQLTIRQFNEELKDVFPYIYKLIGEASKPKELDPEALQKESERTDEALPIILGLLGLGAAAYAVLKYTSAQRSPLGKAIKIACDKGDSDACDYYDKLDLYVDANDQETLGMLKQVYVVEPFGDFDGVPTDESMSPEKPQVPVTEFILSLYDRENGVFPKGETAVLTAIEKDYGEQYINPAKKFIEAINAKFEQFNGYKDNELPEDLVNERNDFAAEVAQKLHQKGIRYDYEDEREIIMKMASLVKELGHERVMSDKDFVADVLDDLANMDHDDDYDGQPSSYDEYQDLHGGDDYDFGQYDETINDIKKLSGLTQ